MKHRIGTLLLAAAFAGIAPAPGVLAQEVGQAQVLANQIEGFEVAEQGGTVYVRMTLREPLSAPPPSFSVANPARIAFDFSGTGNALGRSTQSIEQGDLRSANIVQVGDRTRVVLNLVKMNPYEARIQGRDLIIAISPAAAQAVRSTVVSESQGNFAGPGSALTSGLAVRDINFRRGTEGEGRVIVDLSASDAGVDIRRQGANLVVDFLKTSLPEHLRRRSDVTDFATPVSAMTAQQVGDRVRLTVSPNGLWQHNAYQSENRFVLEVKRVVEDPTKLGRGRNEFQGEKLSLNFQDVDVRSVLQVIADFTDFNIITSDSVQGNVTLRLKDVPWDQALDIILNAKQLGYRKSGNVIWVAPDVELRERDKAELEASALRADLEPLQTENIQVNYHKSKDVAALLESNTDSTKGFLSKRGKVSFDERSNMVFVTDISSRLEAARRLVQEIDRAPQQVLIEARIVEANKTFARDLGVRLGFGSRGTASLGNGAKVGFGLSEFAAIKDGKIDTSSDSLVTTMIQRVGESATSGNGIDKTPYGALSMTLFNSGLTRFLNLELQALESDGRGRVVSSPRVLTANQGNATIKQGAKVPIRDCSGTGADRECDVNYVDALLKLDVVPSITPDGRVQLTVRINKDRPDFSFTVDGVPLIETKEAVTTITVENGGTVLLGGVYEEVSTEGVDRVPVLGDVPVLGALFRTKSVVADRKELLVFITPRLVSGSLTLR